MQEGLRSNALNQHSSEFLIVLHLGPQTHDLVGFLNKVTLGNR